MVCLCYNRYIYFLKILNIFKGTFLFAYLKPQNFINDVINFRNIFYSLFTLFRIATSEGWYLILADTSRSQSVGFICRDIFDFEEYQLYGISMCGTKWAYPFFYTFIILILLIFNLIVGEMINASGELKKQQEKVINVYQLDEIVTLWSSFDHEGSGFMNFKDFWKFTSHISNILGVQSKEIFDLESKKKFLKLLELPVYEDLKKNKVFCFSFYEVVIALSKIAIVVKMGLDEFFHLID